MQRLLFTVLLCVGLLSPAAAEHLTGRIIHIADGDTVTLLTEQNQSVRIRLSGIDAPEKRQPFGTRAREKMTSCAKGKHAVVDTHKKDRYGRQAGTVTVAGTDCGLELLKSGLAWYYAAYEKELPAAKRLPYRHAEDNARKMKRGLWQDKNPQAPWDWRKVQRQSATHRTSLKN